METNQNTSTDLSEHIDKMICFELYDKFIKLEDSEKKHYLVQMDGGVRVCGVLRNQDQNYLYLDLIARGIGGFDSIESILLKEKGRPCFSEYDPEKRDVYPAANFLLDCFFSDSDLQLPQEFDSEKKTIDIGKPGYFAVVRKDYAKNIRTL